MIDSFTIEAAYGFARRDTLRIEQACYRAAVSSGVAPLVHEVTTELPGVGSLLKSLREGGVPLHITRRGQPTERRTSTRVEVSTRNQFQSDYAKAVAFIAREAEQFQAVVTTVDAFFPGRQLVDHVVLVCTHIECISVRTAAVHSLIPQGKLLELQLAGRTSLDAHIANCIELAEFPDEQLAVALQWLPPANELADWRSPGTTVNRLKKPAPNHPASAAAYLRFARSLLPTI